MNAKKMLTMGLAVLLSTSMVACIGGSPVVKPDVPGQAQLQVGDPDDVVNNNGQDVDVIEPDIDIDEVKVDTHDFTNYQNQYPDYTKNIANFDIYDNDYNVLVGVQYDYVQLSWYVQEVGEYPELFEALEDYGAEAFNECQETSKYLEELRNELNDPDQYIYDLWADYVLRADQEVFSFVTKEDAYYGGTSYDTMFTCHNYDTKTGEMIELQDVVEVNEDLVNAIAEKLIKENSAAIPYEEDELINIIKDEYLNGENGFNFCITNTGLSFYFNVYSFNLPRAAGGFTVNLGYNDLANVKFKNTYFPEGKNVVYVEEMIPNAAYYYDLDGDGNDAWITVGYTKETEGDYSYRNLVFYNDNDMLNFNFATLEKPRISIITVGNLKYIIAPNSNFDSLDSYLVFSLSEDGIDWYYNENGYIVTCSDPSKVKIVKHVEVGDYLFAEGEFFINDIGEFCTMEPLKSDGADRWFWKSLQDFDCDLVDDNYGYIEDTTVKAGTKLRFYALDVVMDYLYINDENGNIYRIESEPDYNDEYGNYNTINGVSTYKVLGYVDYD